MYKLGKKDKHFRDTWRGKYAPDPQWYGVMLQYGQERRIRNKVLADLRTEGVTETLLPEIQNDDGVCPAELLFPCYLFVCCRMNDEIYLRITEFDGVVSILGPAWRIPSIVNEIEIRNLKGILNAARNPELVTQKRIGAEAEVITGILKGLRGRILETSANHIKLETSFSFLSAGTGITIAIPKSEVRLVSDLHSPLIHV